MSGHANITELAEQNGLPRNRAKLILDAAGVTRDHNRLYNEVEATAALSAVKDEALSLGHRLTGMGPATGESNISPLALAKAASENERTKKLALDNEIRAGKYIAAVEVRRAQVDFAVHTRNGLLSFGAKLGPRLVGKAEAEIVAAINAEMRHALADLADVDAFMLSGAAS